MKKQPISVPKLISLSIFLLTLFILRSTAATPADDPAFLELQEQAQRAWQRDEKVELCLQVLEKDAGLWKTRNAVVEIIKQWNHEGNHSRVIEVAERYLEICGKEHNDECVNELAIAYEKLGNPRRAIDLLVRQPRAFGLANEIYLRSYARGLDVEPPYWIHRMQPSDSSFTVGSEANLKPADRELIAWIEEDYFLLESPPGFLISKIDIWADVDVKQMLFPEGSFVKDCLFVYPYYLNSGGGLVGSVAYSHTGRQQLTDSYVFERPWPLAFVRLIPSNPQRVIHDWRITATLVRGDRQKVVSEEVNLNKRPKSDMIIIAY